MVKCDEAHSKLLSSILNLSSYFDKMFSLVSASTSELREEAYRLRYQVYCKENNFEPAQKYQDGLEVDEYDERSIHTLLFDKQIRSFVGTVRIILPLTHSPEHSFPIQKICRHPFLKGPKATTAIEISRFALSKASRQKLHRHHPNCESTRTDNHLPFQRQLHMSLMALGLVKAIVKMSKEHGTNDLFAVMEPALLRLLARFGIYFKPIGQLIDYHGMRQPCYSELDALLNRVRRERHDVWEVITEEGKLLEPLRPAAHFSP